MTKATKWAEEARKHRRLKFVPSGWLAKHGDYARPLAKVRDDGNLELMSFGDLKAHEALELSRWLLDVFTDPDYADATSN